MDATGDPLQHARAALERHDWAAAYEAFRAADEAGSLRGPDLEGLAEAAFFTARPDVEVATKERAFAAYDADGDQVRAATMAIDIARDYGFAGKHAISSVWIRRAERIIGRDGDSPAHGYLALVYSEMARDRGEFERATELAQRAIAISEGGRDADLRAYALSNLGELKIAAGDTADGVALMEEASLAAVNGELSPFTTGVTACRTIGACRDLTDYRRANEWIEATERYCSRQSLSGFPGICRIHRAEIAAIGGAWDEAEHELERATVELEAFRATPPQADGFYAMGDVRRLKGDFDGAEAALREAHVRGRSPQPALALVRLAQGRVKAAARALDAALAEPSIDRWARSRLLPARVEVAIAMGDIDTARHAAEALSTIVTEYPVPALEAARHVATARVAVADERPLEAVGELRAAITKWRDVGAPYEIARCRALLARALRALDDDDGAELEVRAAAAEFERLGARVDLANLEHEVRESEARRAGPMVARRTFLFSDIVGSTEIAERLGDAAWEALLRWHDELLGTTIERHRGEVVKSTGDGLFAAFVAARDAVEAAIAIQRNLRDRRDERGDTTQVRIGLHTADANLRAADYSGRGVHVAARVCAAAGAGDVFVTADTLAEAGDVRVRSDPASLNLRGISEPVAVAAVAWDET